MWGCIDMKPTKYMFFIIFFYLIHCFFEILSKFNLGLIWNSLLLIIEVKLIY
jgi:hypothetical protein